jgi:hypothetical protein
MRFVLMASVVVFGGCSVPPRRDVLRDVPSMPARGLDVSEAESGLFRFDPELFRKFEMPYPEEPREKK